MTKQVRGGVRILSRFRRRSLGARALLAMYVVCLSLSCSSDRGDTRVEVKQTIAAETARDSSKYIHLRTDQSIAQLMELEGSFDTTSESGGLIVFVGDLVLFNEFRGRGHEAVDAVVGCLDNESQTRVLLEGRRVSVGVLCLEALDRTAMYEAADSTGDIDPGWPGYASRAATAAELRAAKESWRKVLARRAYLLRKDF